MIYDEAPPVLRWMSWPGHVTKDSRTERLAVQAWGSLLQACSPAMRGPSRNFRGHITPLPFLLHRIANRLPSPATNGMREGDKARFATFTSRSSSNICEREGVLPKYFSRDYQVHAITSKSSPAVLHSYIDPRGGGYRGAISNSTFVPIL